MASFLPGARSHFFVPSGAELPQEERPAAAFHKLTLLPKYHSDRNPLRFGDDDTSELLKLLVAKSGDKLTMADFASCDVRLPAGKEADSDQPSPLIIILGL